jgi:hypothetical protein
MANIMTIVAAAAELSTAFARHPHGLLGLHSHGVLALPSRLKKSTDSQHSERPALGWESRQIAGEGRARFPEDFRDGRAALRT